MHAAELTALKMIEEIKHFEAVLEDAKKNISIVWRPKSRRWVSLSLYQLSQHFNILIFQTVDCKLCSWCAQTEVGALIHVHTQHFQQVCCFWCGFVPVANRSMASKIAFHLITAKSCLETTRDLSNKFAYFTSLPNYGEFRNQQGSDTDTE